MRGATWNSRRAVPSGDSSPRGFALSTFALRVAQAYDEEEFARQLAEERWAKGGSSQMEWPTSKRSSGRRSGRRDSTAAPTGIAISHQRPCPLHHTAQIEVRNVAPIRQHRRPREKGSCARTVGQRPIWIAHISNGLIDDACSEESVGGMRLHGTPPSRDDREGQFETAILSIGVPGS